MDNQTIAIISILITAVLAVITGIYAIDTHKILEQSRKERRIDWLERGLENFYVPIQTIFNSEDSFGYNGEKRKISYIFSIEKNVNQIANYTYLAKPETRDLYLKCYKEIGDNKLEESIKEKNLKDLLNNVNNDIMDYQNELDKLTKYNKK